MQVDEKNLIKKYGKSTENCWIIGFVVLFLLLKRKSEENLSFAKVH